MKLKHTIEKILNKKNLLILLAVGIIFMILPDIFVKNESKAEYNITSDVRIDEKSLAKTLLKIDGIDKVDVFITYNDNGNTNYAYDISNGDNKQELRIKMNGDTPIITQTNYPSVSGILVVAEGKGLSTQKLTEIVKGATGVPLHRIYVVVSKGE